MFCVFDLVLISSILSCEGCVIVFAGCDFGVFLLGDYDAVVCWVLLFSDLLWLVGYVLAWFCGQWCVGGFGFVCFRVFCVGF